MKFTLLLSLCFAAVALTSDSKTSSDVQSTIVQKAGIKTDVAASSTQNPLHRDDDDDGHDHENGGRRPFPQDPCPYGDRRCICPNGRPSNGQGCYGGGGRPYPQPHPYPQDPCPYGDYRCYCPDGRPSNGQGCNGGRPPRPNPRPDCATGYFSSNGQCCYGDLRGCCNLNGVDANGYQCPWGIWNTRLTDAKKVEGGAKTEVKKPTA